MTPAGLSRSAADLRREFDESFAVARVMERPAIERFVGLRLGDDPYAMRMADVGGVYADHDIARMPSPVVAFAGVAMFRGQAASVYDLGVLLGYPPRVDARWLVHIPDAVALALGEFEGQWIVPAADVVPLPGSETHRAHVGVAVRLEGALRPVIDVTSVLDDIRQRVLAFRTVKED